MKFYEFFQILENKAISSKDPVRNAVAETKSYWPKPGSALTQVQDTLYNYGYIIPYASFSVHDKSPQHQQTFEIEKILDPNDLSKTEPTNSDLFFSWYWMPSGNEVEVTVYIT